MKPDEIKLDEALVAEARDCNAESLEELMHRYKPLVKSRAKAYFISGGDNEDLLQEGMIGLYKAFCDFKPTKNAAFAKFADLCVTRQIQTAIKSAARRKHQPLNESVSLENSDPTTPSGKTKEIPTNKTDNPETLFIAKETYHAIQDFIRDELSELEQGVLSLHMQDKSQGEIAAELGKPQKSVDNALQRVRKKIIKLYKQATIS